MDSVARIQWSWPRPYRVKWRCQGQRKLPPFLMAQCPQTERDTKFYLRIHNKRKPNSIAEGHNTNLPATSALSGRREPNQQPKSDVR